MPQPTGSPSQPQNLFCCILNPDKKPAREMNQRKYFVFQSKYFIFSIRQFASTALAYEMKMGLSCRVSMAFVV